MNEFEQVFKENYRKFRDLRELEFSLRGGEYHFIEFKDNIILNSKTDSDYLINIRGKYKKRYFSFNSILKNDLFDIIRVNQKIINKNIIEYPFLKPIKYRNNDISDINFNDFNNLLLFELISKPIFNLLKSKFLINGFIYLRKNRVSPFSNISPINLIINNKNLISIHRQNKIIISLEINKNATSYFINKIFNTIKEVEIYLENEINNINLFFSIKKIKNYNIKNKKIVFSNKSIAKILHLIKNEFSISSYYENKNNIFKNTLNKKIFSHKINIQDTAYHPLLMTAPFDEIGEERRIVNIIKNGYLREFTSSYYESLKYNTSLTGHSFLNCKESKSFSLYLEGGTTKLDSILSQETNIIYINDLFINNKIINLNNNFKILSFNSSIIYKKGKPFKLIENLELSINLKDFFMKVVELTIEKEVLGMITPDIFVSL